MKLNKAVLAILLTTIVGQSDIITFQWKPSSGSGQDKKYLAIPAGKVCKVLTVFPYISFGYVDAAGGDVFIYQFPPPPSSREISSIVIAGPAKIFFKKETSSGSLITLEVVDQNTPKSGVAFTDN